MNTCTVSDCHRPVLCRVMCSRHYQRWLKHGDVHRVDRARPRPAEERFWKKVDKSGDCWEWTGCTAGGYGQFANNKVKFPAHRFSWILHNGPIAAPDLFVCHTCDNKLCVRPDHLFLGTASDNMQDMIKKYDHPKQRNSFRAKLTESDVRHIRKCPDSSYTLAKKYDVDPTSIQNVRRGTTWRKVK